LLQVPYQIPVYYYYVTRRTGQYFSWCLRKRLCFIAPVTYKFQLDLKVRGLPHAKSMNKWNQPSVHLFRSKKKIKVYNKDYIYGFTTGFSTNDVPFCVDPYDSGNLVTAYMKRLSPLMPDLNPEYLIVLKQVVVDFLSKWLHPLPHVNWSVELVEEWLKPIKHYGKGRKKQLIAAAYSVKSKRLNKLDYRCKSFIKREFYEAPKYARVINSRTDRFKVRVAPFIKYIEDQMYQLKWFVKGKDISKLPKDIMSLSKYKYFLQTDYSSFESSFAPQYVDLVECQLWRYMLQNNPEILEDVLRCYYVGNKTIKPRVEYLFNELYSYRVVGARMSGEMWTSLANGFSNLMNILTIASIKKINLDGFIEGDDGLFGMNENSILESDFESLGFKIKMKYETNLSDTTFCGNLFDQHSQRLILNPEYLARLGWSCSVKYLNCSKKVKLELLRAKAMSIHILGKYTPIIGKLTYRILQLLGKGKMRFEISNKWWEMYLLDKIANKNFEYIEPSQEDRDLYFRKFNISVQMQLDLEKIIMDSNDLNDLSMTYQFMSSAFTSGLRFL